MTADLPKLVLFAHDTSLATLTAGGEVERTFAAIDGDGGLIVAIAPNFEDGDDAKLITYLGIKYAMEGVTEYIMYSEAWAWPDRREVLIAVHVARQQDEKGTYRLFPAVYSWDIVTTDGRRTIAEETMISHDVSAPDRRAFATLITPEPLVLPEALIATYRQEKAKWKAANEQ